MVMSVPNVEIYLSNKYQIDENYSFFETKVFHKQSSSNRFLSDIFIKP